MERVEDIAFMMMLTEHYLRNGKYLQSFALANYLSTVVRGDPRLDKMLLLAALEVGKNQTARRALAALKGRGAATPEECRALDLLERRLVAQGGAS